MHTMPSTFTILAKRVFLVLKTRLHIRLIIGWPLDLCDAIHADGSRYIIIAVSMSKGDSAHDFLVQIAEKLGMLCAD